MVFHLEITKACNPVPHDNKMKCGPDNNIRHNSWIYVSWHDTGLSHSTFTKNWMKMQKPGIPK